MTYEFTYKIGTLEANEADWYEKNNNGFKCTGETLEERWERPDGRDSGSTTYVVMTGRFTPYGMCRDCGDHYIIAKWDHYTRIDKGTLKKTVDVEDR